MSEVSDSDTPALRHSDTLPIRHACPQDVVQRCRRAPCAAMRIEVEVRRRGDNEIEVGVKDYGRGMRPEETGRIFRRFYRVAGTGQDTTPGIGLGLALCRHIVRAHRGRIEVESELGKGSTFRVVLPV